jgi:hypothetical protein
MLMSISISLFNTCSPGAVRPSGVFGLPDHFQVVEPYTPFVPASMVDDGAARDEAF